MEEKEILTENIFKTGAFQHLEKPTILTSGEIGIYYCNTEKLAQDNGEFEKYGNDPVGMMKHAIELYHKKAIFNEIIEILIRRVRNCFEEGGDYINEYGLEKAISGGQRRDWLFSFPVAYKLNLPHIAILKNGELFCTRNDDSVEDSINPEEYHLNDPIAEKNLKMDGRYVIHVADLLTEGSSAAKIWIPSLRDAGAEIHEMYNVVTRKQGGEQALSRMDVNANSLVSIDADFIKNGRGTDEQKQRAIDYMKSPKNWSEKYITEYGIDAFVKFFDPKGGKADRAVKFLDRYNDVLLRSGRMKELKNEVQRCYDTTIYFANRKLD